MTKAHTIFIKLATTFGATRNLLRTLESKGIPLIRKPIMAGNLTPMYAKPLSETKSMFNSIFNKLPNVNNSGIRAMNPGGAGVISIPKGKEATDFVKKISPNITPRQILFHEAGHALSTSAQPLSPAKTLFNTGIKFFKDMGNQRSIMSQNTARQSGLLSAKFGKTKSLTPTLKTKMSNEHTRKVMTLTQQHAGAQTLNMEMAANQQARAMMPLSEHATFNAAMKPAYQTYKDSYHRIGQTKNQFNRQKLNTILNALPKAIKPSIATSVKARPSINLHEQSNISLG